MKLHSILLTLANTAILAKASTWQFNVVSLMDQNYEIGLKYENNIIKMKSEAFPVFTTTVESGSSSQYKYVLLDKEGNVIEEEKDVRDYTEQTSSINEVYNRITKNVNIEHLPEVYEPLFKSGTEKYQKYEDNQIYTLYAKCDESSYSNLKYNPFVNNLLNKNSADCDITFVTKTKVYQRTGKLQLIGYDSRKYKKLSWKLKLDKKVLGRKTLKFRSAANDASFMRDKLSSELLRAVGVPTYSSAYARVMINNDIYGLYNIVDTVGGNWLAATIHGDDEARIGTSYKTYAGADLKYLGESESAYQVGTYVIDEIDTKDEEANGNSWYRLTHFTKLFQDWNSKYGDDQSYAAIENLEKFFNLESLLRQMVIESLTFAFDNFWANSGNYAIYYNPEENKYQIIPYDYDGSFYGSKGSPRFATNYLIDINNCINWADNARKDKDTYFISSLFKHDLIKTRYNQILKRTLEKLFNVDTISPFIDSISSLIEDDVAWNSGLIDKLDNKIEGYVNHYTLENFKDNINYKPVDYNPTVNQNSSQFGIKDWIDKRSTQCLNYCKGLSVTNGIIKESFAKAEPSEDIANAEPISNKEVPTSTTTTTTTTTTTAITTATTTTTTAAATTTAIKKQVEKPITKKQLKKIIITTKKQVEKTSTTTKKTTTTTTTTKKPRKTITVKKIITVKKTITVKKQAKSTTTTKPTQV
ncbi:hypothetical protein PIROE2DRAFT_12949 [Piromyces sp. E2]|nr:hypothetical protein PIROE2DRAFT_12949 [Piromyces sp. E2]|eukprot:OUM61113.1 hypothetical protein PIROE2DRAFT_12949 [Piromyces sp. E2]